MPVDSAARMRGTVRDCIDCIGYDLRLPVSCRCLCPAWRDQEPLHLHTPQFIIGTERTPRAPALENFITQGPAMTSLWNAHHPGQMPPSCSMHWFLTRTDHRRRHLRSGLDVRMSQCNAMQCRARQVTAGQDDDGNKSCAWRNEKENERGAIVSQPLPWSSCLHRNLENVSPRRSLMPASRGRTHKPCAYGSAPCLDAR